MTDISLFAPTQQSHVERLPKGRDPDKTGFPLPPCAWGEKGGDIISLI